MHLPEARVLVLAGRGKHFCGGNDLEEFKTLDPENSPGRMKEVREAFFSIYDSTKPVIAAVQGAAVGTGLAIAASCDLVVAAESSRFALPEVNVGVMGGAKHLSRMVPQGVVRLMHLSGDPVPAAKLLPYEQSLNAIEYMDLKSGYEFEQSLTGELSGYEDSKEALNAFLERRTPVYTGR